MNKENVRKLIDLMQAYVYGKTIQVHVGNEWIDIADPAFDEDPKYYRIKPEPEFRHYANAEEFLKAMKEHGPMIRFIENSTYTTYTTPVDVRGAWVDVAPVTAFTKRLAGSYTFKELLENFTWQDNTPCGIAE